MSTLLLVRKREIRQLTDRVLSNFYSHEAFSSRKSSYVAQLLTPCYDFCGSVKGERNST